MTKAKILVVEDEGIIARDLQWNLEHLGYEVPAIFHRGDEAVAHAPDLHPDLVLMDIRLNGGMDGIEAARSIRAKLSVPVVFLTAHADTATLTRANNTRPAGYLVKPVHEASLRASIETALCQHAVHTVVETQAWWLSRIMNDLPWHVVACDPHGQITEVNPGALHFLGWSLGDCLGADLDTRLPFFNKWGDRMYPDSLVERVMRSGLPVRDLEAWVKLRNGSLHPVLCGVAPLRDVAGALLGGLLVFHDRLSLRNLEGDLRDRIRSLEADLEPEVCEEEFLGVCSHCRKVRQPDQSWLSWAGFFLERWNIKLTHTICHGCLERHYPDYAESVLRKASEREAGGGGTD